MKLCTILIPTYNRPSYLKRVLSYFESFKEKITIIVLDSSFEENQKQNKIITDKFKTLNLKYLNFSNKIKIEQKITKGLDFVKTKYCVFCADDDFIIPGAIKSCLDFLEKNPDYSSAQGQYISFFNIGSIIIYRPRYLHTIGIDINSNKSSERLKQQFSPYMHQVYSVHKTETLKQVFSDSKDGLTNLYLIELLTAAVAAINGKHKILPIFYAAREKTRKPLRPDRILNDITTNKQEYDYFIQRVAQHLMKNEKITLLEAKEAVSNIIDKYKNDVNLSKKPMKSFLAKIVNSYLPKACKNFIKKIRLEIIKNKEMKSIKNLKGFPFYDAEAKKDLKKIDYFIKKYKI